MSIILQKKCYRVTNWVPCYSFSNNQLWLFYRFKVQAVEDMKELYHFKHERFMRRDLMRLTWTTKHRYDRFFIHSVKYREL